MLLIRSADKVINGILFYLLTDELESSSVSHSPPQLSGVERAQWKIRPIA